MPEIVRPAVTTVAASPSSKDVEIKHCLVALINEKIASRDLGQTDAGRILGLKQPKVSALANGKISGFSIERLMELLTKLGQNVEITVRKAQTPADARIHVTTI
jgi:predicted XRE-type DNA-binding protein